jgi:hypothetical protein
VIHTRKRERKTGRGKAKRKPDCEGEGEGEGGLTLILGVKELLPFVASGPEADGARSQRLFFWLRLDFTHRTRHLRPYQARVSQRQPNPIISGSVSEVTVDV